MTQIHYQCECEVGNNSLLEDLHRIWCTNKESQCLCPKLDFERKMKATYYTFKAHPYSCVVILIFLILFNLYFSDMGITSVHATTNTGALYKNCFNRTIITTEKFKEKNYNTFYAYIGIDFDNAYFSPCGFNNNKEAYVLVDIPEYGNYKCKINMHFEIIDCQIKNI